MLKTAGELTATHTIVLAGELDMANVDELEQAIDEGIEAGARDFIVDLSAVEFIDATTIHALLRGWNRTARRNGQFMLVRPPYRIWRVFVLIGVARTFAVFASQQEARGYLAAGRS